VPKRKVCFFCANKNEVIDYKNAERLRTYMSDRAKIEPRRRSGTCAKHQRALATAIKRARHLALLPYVPEHIYPGHAVAPTAGQAAPASAPAPAPITPQAVAPSSPVPATPPPMTDNLKE
jgi:small subunit ribosomal protein S18